MRPIITVSLLFLLAAPSLRAQCVATEEHQLLASDAQIDDEFGAAVAVDNDVALVGADNDAANGLGAGSVTAFRRNGESWEEVQQLIASDGEVLDLFGGAVALDGDVAVVGACGNDDNGSHSGSAYVFRFDGEMWVEEQRLLASDGQANDEFGCAVSVCGDVALIGAVSDDEMGVNCGSAYVFRFNGESWVEEQKLQAQDAASSDFFGGSVALDDDMALIGAFADDDQGPRSGSAYLFHFNGEAWVEAQKLLATDGSGGDSFGAAVALNDDVALIGANLDDDNGLGSGSAYVFRFDGETWGQEKKLLASDGQMDDGFGSAVSLDDDVALIGAFGSDDTTGSAYVFRFNHVTWVEEEELVASDGETTDEFGAAVGLDGDVAVVGAWKSSARSAYLFKIPGIALDIDPEVVIGGAPYQIRTCGGVADEAVTLVVTKIGLVPLFVPVLYSTFDEEGVWEISLTAPTGPIFDEVQIHFQSFGVGQPGRVRASNTASVTFEVLYEAPPISDFGSSGHGN